jgi:hypothetical protein
MRITRPAGDTRLTAKDGVRRSTKAFSVPRGGSDMTTDKAEGLAETGDVDFGGVSPFDESEEGSARHQAFVHCQESIDALTSLQRMCAEGVIDVERVTAMTRRAAYLPPMPVGDPLREILEHINERLAIESAKISAKGTRV